MKPAGRLILAATAALPALAFALSVNGQPANEKTSASSTAEEISQMIDFRLQKVRRDYLRRLAAAIRINIQFLVSDTLGGDENTDDLARALREKIYRDAARECETLELAFDKACRLSSINITPVRNTQTPEIFQLRGNTQFTLTDRTDAKTK